eukprot:3898097-Alexandrium_andersonii.AAC.1
MPGSSHSQPHVGMAAHDKDERGRIFIARGFRTDSLEIVERSFLGWEAGEARFVLAGVPVGA